MALGIRRISDCALGVQASFRVLAAPRSAGDHQERRVNRATCNARLPAIIANRLPRISHIPLTVSFEQEDATECFFPVTAEYSERTVSVRSCSGKRLCHGRRTMGKNTLHVLVADGLFDREGRFHVMRAGEQGDKTDAYLAGIHAELEQLFRARVIAFLVEAGLLPLDRARMLRGWVHSGF